MKKWVVLYSYSYHPFRWYFYESKAEAERDIETLITMYGAKIHAVAEVELYDLELFLKREQSVRTGFSAPPSSTNPMKGE